MHRALDTNIYSYILRRHPAEMIEWFACLDKSQLWLSAMVAAELRFGAAKLAFPRFQAAVKAWLAGAGTPRKPMNVECLKGALTVDLKSK